MKKTIYVNISFDDLHPEYNWGAIGDPVMLLLLDLTTRFPNIKYSFFATPDYQYEDESKLTRFIKRRLHLLGIKNYFTSFKKKTDNKYNLKKHTDWSKYITEKISSGIFELGIHGLNHYNPYIIPGAEFSGLNEIDTRNHILQAEEIFHDSGIAITKMFRVPAWGINRSIKKTLANLEYKYVSLNPKQRVIEVANQGEYILYYIPQNHSIEFPDFPHVYEHLRLCNYLFIKGHLYPGLKNGVRKETIDNLKNILSSLGEDFNISFIHIKEIENLYLDNKLACVNKI